MAESRVTVRLFPDKLKKVTDDRGGPLDKWTRDKAERVASIASGLVGRRYSGHHGASARNITTEPIEPSPSYAVISRDRAALFQHFGTRPHIIRSRRGPRGVLFRDAPDRFGPVRGSVRHPGSRPNPYLVDAARAAGFTVQTGRGGRSTLSSEIFTARGRPARGTF